MSTPSTLAAPALLDRIRSGLIGDDEVLDEPFGPKRIVHADYTASGRSLGFIEDFVREQVLPRYGNTHTESSSTGVLVVRRELVRNPVPTAPGGGTVAFVDPLGHQYLDDPVPGRTCSTQRGGTGCRAAGGC